MLRETEEFWSNWSAKIRLPPEYKDIVMRSLITLKACTYAPSGAIVAAPTFGLPETPGGERNWDYRFTWVRDSMLTLNALILDKGYDANRNRFTQYYGSKNVDASLLFISLTGFSPATDSRVIGTVKAIEEDLMQDGLVLRYRTDASDDGLSGEEGVFLARSFWLAVTYHLMGRTEDARRLFERVANLRNDVGLLAEEYLTSQKRQIGNFPQAFSHLALANAAHVITENHSPAEHPEG